MTNTRTNQRRGRSTADGQEIGCRRGHGRENRFASQSCARGARPLLGPMAVRNRIGGDRGPAGRKESSHGWAATCRIPSRNQAIRGVERANRSISRALCQPLSQLPKHGCTRPCRFRLRRCPVVANGSDENRDVPFEKPADRCHLEQKSNLKHSDVEVLRMQVGKNLTL